MGHAAHMEGIRNVYKSLVEKPEGKIPFGRHRHKWEDTIKMNLKEVWWEVVDGFIWLRVGTNDRLL